MGRNAAKGKNYDSHCEAQALLLYLDSILFVICPMRVTFSFSNRFSTFLFDFKSKNLQCSARKGPKCSICPKLCMFQVNQKTGVTIDKTVNEVAWDMCRFSSLKQDHLRMNVAPNQTIILGLQIFLNHRSLSSINQKILITSHPRPHPPFSDLSTVHHV